MSVARSEKVVSAVVPWRGLLIGTVVAATVLGFVGGSAQLSADAVRDAGPELTRLMQFMAVAKGVMSLALCAVIAWRMGLPLSGRLAVVYLGSAAAICLAPGLIWQMAHPIAGAVLFHGGLLSLVGGSLFDQGAKEHLKGSFNVRVRKAEQVIAERDGAAADGLVR